MERATPDRFTASRRMLLLLAMGLTLLLMVPGCGGCTSTDPTEADLEELRKKKKREDKQPLELKLLESSPRDLNLSQVLVKPGHWLSVIQNVQVNDFEQVAELRGTVIEKNGDAIRTEHTAYTNSNFRPAALPKDTLKRFESELYVPRRVESSGRRKKIIWLEEQLRTKSTGRRLAETMFPTVTMPSYQYFMFVLVSVPAGYGYVERLESVTPANDTLGQIGQVRYYRVVLPKKEDVIPLPSHPLTWSNIGYIIWDRYDPSMLTPDQKASMVDWLHWGGQLIISGPNTLNVLRSSFLGPYLPAEADKTVPLATDAFKEMNEHWSLHSKTRNLHLTIEIVKDAPIVGITFKKHEAAEDVTGTGGLVVERRIGSGRVVATAFRLSERRIVNWRSFDSFFNNALLRRPQRKFEVDYYGNIKLSWDDANYHILDPRFTTSLRYFSRDIGRTIEEAATPEARDNTFRWTPEQEQTAAGMPPPNFRGKGRGRKVFPNNAGQSSQEFVLKSDKEEWHQLGYEPSRNAGMAGWNDRSGASDAARQALTDAAGISIPKAKFVLRVLLIYLVILVPVNWGFFRLIGRVEWAWVAAPLIAIGGAVAVVKLAQLDIGFARSRNEIAVIEIQADYHRAHITRYIALYTSLSTGYQMTFEQQSALAQPFAVNPRYKKGIHDTVTAVSLHRDGGVRLNGYQVKSNSTGMLHAEHMHELGGQLQLKADKQGNERVQNATNLSIREAGVVRRRLDGTYQVAWIGDLGSQESHDLSFSSAERAWLAQWDVSPVTSNVNDAVRKLVKKYDTDNNRSLTRSEVQASDELRDVFDEYDSNNNDSLQHFEVQAVLRKKREGSINLGRLMELAASQLTLRPGDTRLIGWMSEEPIGMKVRPRASQVIFRGLVLAHLKRAKLPGTKPDTNCRFDVDPDFKYNPLREKDVGAE